VFIAALAATTLWLAAPGPILAKSIEHPRLVSVEAAECTFCHEDLLEGRTVVHAPVSDDCTICHEMKVSEGGTTTSLMDQEPALCVMCHDDLAAAAGAELEVFHMPVADSCLICHEPHASANRRLLTAVLPEVCTECHDLEDLNTAHGGQLTGSTRCVACHQPHGSDNPRMLLAKNLHPPFEEGSCKGCHRQPFGDRIRLRMRGERLCEACHGKMEEEAEPAVSVHAALKGRRGRAGCLSCHDPHMSDARKMLVKSGPELCGICHGEVVAAAQATSGHAAAADDCLTCHVPHAAEQSRLLVDPAQELCVMCHDVEDDELIGTHLGADLASLTCTHCHTPHGSGHRKLMARTLHPVIEDGCDICHEGAFDELIDDGESSLCLMCHDDIGEIAEQAEWPHGAMEMARCADCHNPHASPQEHLVKLPGGRECYDCHDDKFPEEGEVAHAVIDIIGCRACHEPHGSQNEKLLRRTGSELCLGCHDSRAVAVKEGSQTATLLGRFEVPAGLARSMASLVLSGDGQHNHPTTGHRVLGTPTPKEIKRSGTSFEGELTCLTCHDPHKGRFEKILRWGVTSSVEACRQCHDK
jgi:predicted CXXCH cytochrome family protein